MRASLAVVLSCLAGGFASTAAAAVAERTPFQIRCEDTIRKTVSVLSSKQNGYTINNQLPYRAVTLKTGSIDGRMQTLGLTVTQGRFSANMDGAILQDPVSGYECIAPKVEIKLYYSSVMIYVGNEFVPGSCAYKTILAHEERHLDAYVENLVRVEKVVGDALSKRFEGKPLYAPSGTAMSALQHEINSTWFPFIQNEFDKGKAKQALIDTPEAYARLGKSCNGEINEIMLRRTKRTEKK